MSLAWVLIVGMLWTMEVLVGISRAMNGVNAVWHGGICILLHIHMARRMAGTRIWGWQLPVAYIECSHFATHVVSSCRIQRVGGGIYSSCQRVCMGSTAIVCPRIGLTWSAAGRLASLRLRILTICLHLLRVHRVKTVVARARRSCAVRDVAIDVLSYVDC